MDDTLIALVQLGRALQDAQYHFTTVTPATHHRVRQRAARPARDLRDVFGWNLPFAPGLLPPPMLQALQASNMLDSTGALLRARVRFSSLAGKLFVHSGFPTDEPDAVFFGPDTYRYHALLQRWAPACRRMVDVGCGSGAGGICAAGRTQHLVLGDIGERALALTRVNLMLNAVDAEVVYSDILQDIQGELDLVVANPPYIRDELGRLYRDGGGAHGEALGVRIVEQALQRLAHGGTLILYTGTAVVAGTDTFFRAVEPLLQQRDLRFTYEELDPDVFGEELERPAYADVERIAAVGLRVSVGEGTQSCHATQK